MRHVDFSVEIRFFGEVRQTCAMVNMEVSDQQKLDLFWVRNMVEVRQRLDAFTTRVHTAVEHQLSAFAFN